MRTVSMFALMLWVCAFAATAQAQDKRHRPVYQKDTLVKSTYGVKVGGNFGQILGDQVFESDYAPGAAGGFFFSSDRKHVGMRAELMASSAKYTFLKDSSGQQLVFKLINADITLMLEVEAIKNLWIQAGPQFSTFIDIKAVPAAGVDPRSYFNSMNFAAAGGLEYRLPYQLMVGVRYNYGFSDIRSEIAKANIPGNEWTTRSIHAYVAYRIK